MSELDDDGKRALSWKDAMAMGFEASPYTAEPLPDGPWIGTLEWKIWGKSMCLACYFVADDGSRYRLTAFRARRGPGADKWYTAQDEEFDMSAAEVRPGQRFSLITGKNGKGNPSWLSVRPLGIEPPEFLKKANPELHA